MMEKCRLKLWLMQHTCQHKAIESKHLMRQKRKENTLQF